MKKYPVVIVHWSDHYDVSDWTPIEGYTPQEYVHETVGFLIKTTRKHLVLARTLTPDGNMDGVMNIIRKNIKETRTLKQ